MLLAFALISQCACNIKRDNPLDPNFDSNITIPVEVSGVQSDVYGVQEATPYVNLSWNSNSHHNTDGYIIYRSLGYYSAYAIIATRPHIQGSDRQSYSHSSADDPTVAPGDYYYRISAYKDYEAGRLEGRQSSPHFVRIPSQ